MKARETGSQAMREFKLTQEEAEAHLGEAAMGVASGLVALAFMRPTTPACW